MSENVKALLKGVGVDFVSRTPVSKKIVSETRQDSPERLSNKEIFAKELKEISEKAEMFRILEEAEKRIKAEQKIEKLQETLTSPFTQNKKVDMNSSRNYAIDELLPKALIPKITSYPEPFEEEPALNRELAEFKKKINEHLHKIGIAGSGGGGAGIMGDLDDVNISGRTHKSILMWNDVANKYEVADPDLDAGISNEDDSGDEIILDATTSGGADEGGSIQQEDNTRVAALATNITASANNNTNETVYPTFVDGATGTQGLETDTGLTYNPSTGVLTSTEFSGNLTGPIILNGTDGSSTDAGDHLVQNTDANDGDQILYEDGTFDVIAVFASHGITLAGYGWWAFQLNNDP
jgi:hypothetical protein